jgi:hypothetical protein
MYVVVDKLQTLIAHPLVHTTGTHQALSRKLVARSPPRSQHPTPRQLASADFPMFHVEHSIRGSEQLEVRVQ